jgi:hypothetical protein
MRARLSPSFVVAVLALVLASGGVGFAAGKVTSAQIQDGTIVSRDVRNGGLAGIDVRDRSLTGADLRDRSVPRSKLDKRCASSEAAVFGGCVRRVGFGRSTYAAAVADCNKRGGRLPSVAELRWIATNDEFTWADGSGTGQYEFSGEYTDTYPVTPIGLDQNGNVVSNSSALLFYHHCVIS